MICENCSKPHNGSYGSGRFCGLRCARSWSTKKKNETRIRKCWCLIEFNSDLELQVHKLQSHNNRKFEDLRGDKARKKWLLKERGIQCELCKITEWMNQPVPLVMDHVDGNPGNSIKENLRLICGNCNMQTSTFCGKNIRKFLTKTERAEAMARYPRYRDLRIKIPGFESL